METLQVKMQKKVAENPFFGKEHMKALQNNAVKASSKGQLWSLLDTAWQEAKNKKETREGFFVIVFSIGDITDRQHNIFGKKKTDAGGEAARPQFMWAMSWLRKNNPAQYYKFMFAGLINQFVSWFAILASQVRTKKGSKVIIDTETYNALAEQDLNKVAEYIAKVIQKGSDIDKMMLAKWLVLPRTSKRQKVNREGEKVGSRSLQSVTKDMMQNRIKLYEILSKLVKWEVKVHANNMEFVGLKEFKKQYNKSLESVLFSTQRITELDRAEFLALLDSAPAGARYRIQRRLFDGDGKSKGKWKSQKGNVDLAEWFKEWEDFKVEKQTEERVLTEKLKQTRSAMSKEEIEETEAKLEKVKKEAKVTTGGMRLIDELEKLAKGQADDKLIHSIMNKIEFKVPVLTVADCSGSMGGLPTFIARLLATVTMLKNPSTEIEDMLVRFGSNCEIITGRTTGLKKKNRFLEGVATEVTTIVDRTRSFQENFNNISQLIHSNMGGTHLSSVSRTFKSWIEADPDLKQSRIEQLQRYPVILVVSDGDLNSSWTPKESMLDFTSVLRQYGWNGVVVVWDVAHGQMGKDKFEGIPNVIHYYGYNLSIINQVFTNYMILMLLMYTQN